MQPPAALDMLLSNAAEGHPTDWNHELGRTRHPAGHVRMQWMLQSTLTSQRLSLSVSYGGLDWLARGVMIRPVVASTSLVVRYEAGCLGRIKLSRP